MAAENATQERFHLAYGAPEGCPSEAEFAGWVSAQLNAPWQAEVSEFAGVISVTVREDGGAYAAHLVMAGADGQNGLERRHRVESCSDAVAAMAFSAAAAIQIIWNPAPVPKPTPAPPVPSQPRQSRPLALQHHFEVGADGGREWGMGPSGAWGGSVFVGYRWPTSGASVRLGAQYWSTGWSGLEGAGDSRVKVALAGLRAEGCLYEVQVARGLAIPLCVRAEMGWQFLHGQANGTERTSRGNWLAIGALPRLRVSRWGAFLEATGGVSFPIYRADVNSEMSDGSDSRLEYETSSWVSVFTLGAGWEFF